VTRPYIGGQAVLEGVMMRAPWSFSVVVRRADGTLLVRERAMERVVRGVAKWPLVRGVASVAESLRLGSEALRFSVEQMERDLAGAGAQASKALGVLSAFAVTLLALTSGDVEPSAPAEQPQGRRAGTWLMLAVAVGFFVAIPQVAAAAVNRWLGLGMAVQSGGFQVLTGAFKLAVVTSYLLLIRRIPDIRRLFQYHGAEHKTISTYEAGEPLTVAAARAKTTLHPRCGTTFLVMVALVSILVFVGVGAALPRIHTGSVLLDNLAFFAEKLPFLPVIAAVTFELQRFLARYAASGPLRILLAPGFLVQRITTAEPTDDQLEVALASLRATLFRQEEGLQAGAGEDDVSFATYDAFLAVQQLRQAA
jgi:uncharacterized protein YqhQ